MTKARQFLLLAKAAHHAAFKLLLDPLGQHSLWVEVKPSKEPQELLVNLVQ